MSDEPYVAIDSIENRVISAICAYLSEDVRIGSIRAILLPVSDRIFAIRDVARGEGLYRAIRQDLVNQFDSTHRIIWEGVDHKVIRVHFEGGHIRQISAVAVAIAHQTAQVEVE